MHPREPRLATLAVLAIALTLGACSGGQTSEDDGPVTSEANDGLIRLDARGPDGELLDHDGFVAIQSNGRGDGGYNDALVDPDTLDVIQMYPIFAADDDGGIVLLRPPGDVALTLAWPTSLGYSTLVIELPPPGRYDFNLLAAEAAVAELRDHRPDPTPEVWEQTFTAAEAALGTARATSGAEAAAAADEALDLAARTSLLPHGTGRSPAETIKGVTIDRVLDDPAIWTSIRDLAGGRQPWARIVFDPGVPAETYRSTVDAATTAGVSVLGELLDSSAMADVPLDEFEARVREYVDAFPELAAWEVGNEVNGNWLGPDVVAKIRYAAQYVKDTTDARTMLTLYWQLGEDTEDSAMFSWLTANVDDELAALIDDVSVSMWVEEHPMGSMFDRVFRQLAERFPDKGLFIGELGYGNDDLETIWWWGDPDDETGAARRAVADTYWPLAFDRPELSGGGFWWYYLDDLTPPNELWRAIAAM